MALRTFALPDLGEGLEEAEIIEWHVGPGDRVVADQPLVSVETGKAVVEILAPWGGTVTALHAQKGNTVSVGTPLASFDLAMRADAGAIVGKLETVPPSQPIPPASPEPANPTRGAHSRAMPAARALAQRAGINLSQLDGTGAGGVIQRADVAAFLAAEAGWTPLSAPRRAMARAMAAAHAEVVPATLQNWADVTGWFAPEADVLVRLVRAVVVAAGAEPALNAWFDGTRMVRQFHDHVDLGVAVDTPAGLYVPVLADAGGREAPQIRAELDRLIAAVRRRGLKREQQTPPTLSLSNFGALGGAYGVLVVTPPQVAILGAGRVETRAIWGEEGAAPRFALPLSLTFDHRAVTGGEAARFMAAVRTDLQKTS